MNRRRARAILAALKRMTAPQRARALAALPPGAFRAIEEEWWWGTLEGQREPIGDWRVWTIMAGRGFGKTRAGAEWVWARARENGDARIALVGGTLDDVDKVMVEGESGILASARSGEDAKWTPSRGVLLFSTGAKGFAYSGERPGALRGPQHHHAWCDELAKWRRPGECWDNLMFGLRLGERPRAIVTTTPQPGPVLKRILALPRSVATHGRSDQNPHSPADYRSAMQEIYGGTRLGRQELEGVLFEDVEGALWTRDLIEACKGPPPSPDALRRVVIGVDPPASAEGNACGIVACGMTAEGVAYVLGDHSVAGASPKGWAAKVAAAAEIWGADRVIAEANNGGNMVGEVLESVGAGLRVTLVHASRGKIARAEPIVGRFEAGKAKFAGSFPELEDELAGMTSGGQYHGPGNSPDRADAMVWAMTELFKPKREPRVLRL